LEYGAGGELTFAFRNAVKGLSKEELDNLATHLGTARKVAPMNQNVARAAARVASLNKTVAAAARAVGITVKRRGTKVPFEPRDPEGFYWHYEYTKEFWDWLGKDPKTREGVIKGIMSEGKSRFEAEQLLRMARKFGEKRISEQYSRELEDLADKYLKETGLPAFKTSPTIMEGHYLRMADRLARAKVMGPEDIVDPLSPISQELERAGIKGKDVDTLYRYLARILERDTPPETYKYKVGASISNGMVATFLQQFPISNLTQIPMIGVYAPVRPFVEGMIKAGIDYKSASQKALRSGASLEAHRVMEDFGGKVLNKWYLGQASERFNRTMADSVGRTTAAYWHAKLRENPGNTGIARKLGDLTLMNPNKLAESSQLPEIALRRAGYNMSRISQGTTHPEDLAFAWSDSPLSKLYWLFQRYAFNTTRNMWQAILEDPIKAPLKILIYLGLAGELIGDVKKFITEGIPGVVHRGEWLGIKNPILRRGVDDLIQGWALGIVGDALSGLWIRGEVHNSVPLEMVDKVGSMVRDVAKGKFKRTGQELLRRAPIPFGVGARIQKEVLPTQRQKARERKGKGGVTVKSPYQAPKYPTVSPP